MFGDGDRRQDRLEDDSGARMVAGVKGLRGSTEMVGHVFGIGMAHSVRGFCKRLRLVDDALRWAAGPPARRGLRGTDDERIDDVSLHVRVEPIEYGVHRRAQFRRAHRLQRAVDLRVFGGRATSPATKRTYHGTVSRGYALRRRRRVIFAYRA